jgi:molybdopterin synthase catalytic subunit
MVASHIPDARIFLTLVAKLMKEEGCIMSNHLFMITTEPISIEEVVNKVIRPEAGAISTFIGTVREITNGKRTLFLQYEAYVSMAEKKLAQIGEEIVEKWPDAKVAITHRIGKLDISDIAVVIAVSTPHRKDAFEASRYAIERIKQIVPIWKKEHWENGEEWVGNQLETKAYPTGKPEKEDLL